MTTKHAAKEITARAKVFGIMANHDFRVFRDGTVTVWDDVARHYTQAFLVSKRVRRRIFRLVDWGNDQ